ncbi:MAG: carboxypeptidase regulatory-like domain-containing protein [Anaerolineae bacterium]|nr:carboxypeptidase regulatory-like domain-containing protein [Anaerolineae bacterium]
MRATVWVFCVLLGFGLILIPDGVSAQGSNEDLIILIGSPGEGETFYTLGNFRLSMPITGQVISYSAHVEPSEVEVTVELVDTSGNTQRMTVPLDDQGWFHASAVMTGPDRPWPSDDPHVIEDCGMCHNADSPLTLNDDVAYLIVTAHSTDGRSGQAVRSLRFDRGTTRTLLVTIEGLPPGSSGVQIDARTKIYDWRWRNFYGPAVDGVATLAVEGLTHHDLTYQVSMIPVIIDGKRYTAAPQEVIVPGGQEAPVTISMTASAAPGTISGQLMDTGGQAISGSILAIDLASGAGLTTTADDAGHFVFTTVPISRYALLAQSSGYVHAPRQIDLTRTPEVEAELHLIPAGSGTVRGTIRLDTGESLPFAEVMVEGLPVTHADPLDGRFALPGVAPEGPLAMRIAAAGCYGVQLSSTERDYGEIALSLRSDTEIIRQGGARLYRPAATIIAHLEGVIALERGVLWSVGAAGEDTPLRVQAGRYLLESTDADFAVESLSNAEPRLYVSRGEVRASDETTGQIWTVGASQTLALTNPTGRPVTLIAGAGPLLRAVAGSVSPFELAPSPAEQRDRAVLDALVTAARITMLLAYAISFGIFPILVVVGLVLYFRRRA